jgi:hypothetical protein
MKRIMLVLIAMLFGAGGAMVAAQSGAAPACPDRLVGTPSVVCACSAAAAGSGSVWGSDLYTDDSAVCRAAVHAGVIEASGGTIWVFERPGLASYPAVTRHGVASSAWPEWRRSIAFRPAAEASSATAQSGPEACPANASSLSEGTALSCACTIEAIAAGSVWGDGPYTADSSICRAARHAGAVGDYGGAVRLTVVAGRSSYPAATRNGIESASWANYGTSIAFER